MNNPTSRNIYEKLGEQVKIEVVAFGPGLHMLRDDTSPVKTRIDTMALGTPEVSFKAAATPRRTCVRLNWPHTRAGTRVTVKGDRPV